MGFEDDRVTYALKSTDNHAERAADWLMSHIDEPLPAETTAAAAASASSSSSSETGSLPPAWTLTDQNAPGKYTLVGIISHMGNSANSGHYVAHIRKDDATGALATPAAPSSWYIFNDSKVAKSTAPPLDLGFIYIYKNNAAGCE